MVFGPMPAAEEHILRRLLTAIEEDAAVSQRRLSVDMGIAVGSVNWYLKRSLKKGLIKFRHAPVKRYLYYLTPRGFEEKSRLTAAYLQRSFELYRQGRTECAEFFAAAAAGGMKTIFLIGDGDLAEIAALSALGTSVEVKAIVDRTSQRPACAGIPVYPSLRVATSAASLPDALLITDLRRPNRVHTEVTQETAALGLSAVRIHALPLLRVRPND
jgi:hypothetical protein